MIVASVPYPKTASSRFDHEYYLNKHIPMVKDRLSDCGLKEIRLLKGLGSLDGGALSYELIGELVYSSLKEFQDGMVTHGNEIISDIPNFTDVQPSIQLNEELDPA